jgi:hypothetical protein
MGRFGVGIYDSDRNMDFLFGIKKFLKQEAAYVFSPEQIEQRYSKTLWLRDALTIVEIINFFAEPYEEHFGLPAFLEDYDTAIMRWREAFFSVWDGEWNDTPDFAPYSQHTYRIEHRYIAVTLFDRLIDISNYWRHDLPERDIQPFAYLDNLPVFTPQSRDPLDQLVGQFFEDLIEKLTHHIVFFFSEENREKERGFHINELEEMLVSVDIIGLLCEKYQISPQLRPQTVQRWLDTATGLWLNSYSTPTEPIIDMQTLLEKEGPLYTNAVTAFVRLITVAQRYPGRFEI